MPELGLLESGVPKQQSKGEEDALERQIAALREKPLVGRVGLAALSAGANRDRRDIERDRNIRVGRRAIEMRSYPQVCVDGAQVGEDGRAIGQLAGGPGADLFQ